MKLFSIASMCMLTSFVYSQSSAEGRITDIDGNPIASALIWFHNTQRSVATNTEGTYSVENLPAARLQITISAPSYKSLHTFIDTQIPGPHNFQLAREEHFLDEVVISTPFSRLQSENVTKVSHIGIQELEQAAGIGLAERLATIPGMSQISTGTGIGKPVIRGLSGNRVLVYSQGLRMENQQFGDEHGLGLSENGLGSVEIIKGPASLLYGSDALGGVLYFNPARFTTPGRITADVKSKYFSNTNGLQLMAGVKAASQSWQFNANAATAAHADYRLPSGNRVNNTRFNESDFKTSLGYGKNRYSGTVRFSANKLETGIPEGGETTSSASKSVGFPKQQISHHTISLQNGLQFQESKLEATLGYQLNNRKELEEAGEAHLAMDLNTFSYDLRYTHQISEKLQWASGIQGMDQENINHGEEWLIPNARTTDFGAYSTFMYDWGKSTVQGGLRWDNRYISFAIPDQNPQPETTRNFSNITGAAGLRFPTFNNITLRLNAAGGFRSPNLAELASDGVHEGTNRYEVGNNQLKSERNIQLDASLDLNTEHLDIEVNGFYNHIDNYIYASPNGETLDGHDVFLYVQDNSVLYGGELAFHFHPHPVDWLHLESSIQTVTAEKQDGSPLPLIPAASVNTTLRAEFAYGKWLKKAFGRINFEHTFAQNSPGAFETSSVAYSLVNCGIGGTLSLGRQQMLVQLHANNLFDKTYIPHLSRLKPDAVPNIGRNISISVDFSL